MNASPETPSAWAASLRALAVDIEQGRAHVVTGYENDGLPASDGERRSALVLIITRPGAGTMPLLSAQMSNVLHDSEGWQRGQRVTRCTA